MLHAAELALEQQDMATDRAREPRIVALSLGAVPGR
jgi:hypothetical protein